jgi:hypothetical protein
LAVVAPAGSEHDLLGEALDRLGAAGLLAKQVADAQQQQDRAPVDGIGEDRASAREAGTWLGSDGAAQDLVGDSGDHGMGAADRLGCGIEAGIDGDPQGEIEAGLVPDPELARDQGEHAGLAGRAKLTAEALHGIGEEA